MFLNLFVCFVLFVVVFCLCVCACVCVCVWCVCVCVCVCVLWCAKCFSGLLLVCCLFFWCVLGDFLGGCCLVWWVFLCCFLFKSFVGFFGFFGFCEGLGFLWEGFLLTYQRCDPKLYINYLLMPKGLTFAQSACHNDSNNSLTSNNGWLKNMWSLLVGT